MWEAIVNFFTNTLIIIYQYTGQNFGVAIVLFTILIRLLTHPLMARQIKSTQKMQELQQSKEWGDIQKKYKDNREQLAQEQMKLYQKEGVSPFGSCLPTFVQLPIMFALYQSVMRALASSPMQLLILTRAVWTNGEMSNLIPLNSQFLWMNLGQPERIYIAGLGIPLLALIVAVTTFIQTKVTMPPPNPTNPPDQAAAMNSSMTMMMPLMMGYFALTFASGLAVYIIVGNLLSLVQYALLGRVYWSNLLPKSKRQEKSK
ncbi:MAG: membrane protein insertase YidC [Anaerolineales bacterium]|nr:membrane protein insertase YidC [Anaerolineales bacterium]